MAAGAIVISSVILSVDYFVSDVLKPHQQNRVKALINPDGDPLGYGWNVTQSKIAIGSGGFAGKGFLNGTQTKFDFVPAQSTDFIFCTIGEEHGWLGSFINHRSIYYPFTENYLHRGAPKMEVRQSLWIQCGMYILLSFCPLTLV